MNSLRNSKNARRHWSKALKGFFVVLAHRARARPSMCVCVCARETLEICLAEKITGTITVTRVHGSCCTHGYSSYEFPFLFRTVNPEYAHNDTWSAEN